MSSAAAELRVYTTAVEQEVTRCTAVARTALSDARAALSAGKVDPEMAANDLLATVASNLKVSTPRLIAASIQTFFADLCKRGLTTRWGVRKTSSGKWWRKTIPASFVRLWRPSVPLRRMHAGGTLTSAGCRSGS